MTWWWFDSNCRSHVTLSAPFNRHLLVMNSYHDHPAIMQSKSAYSRAISDAIAQAVNQARTEQASYLRGIELRLLSGIPLTPSENQNVEKAIHERLANAEADLQTTNHLVEQARWRLQNETQEWGQLLEEINQYEQMQDQKPR